MILVARAFVDFVVWRCAFACYRGKSLKQNEVEDESKSDTAQIRKSDQAIPDYNISRTQLALKRPISFFDLQSRETVILPRYRYINSTSEHIIRFTGERRRDSSDIKRTVINIS